ncbi:acyl-CoA dehydrogenase family protein [Streptomyces sp. DH37]|uniref:acyl-CoA dehydrogenase family protein n=1 Tax=Streptomyces sp. DH37 TaxID=3040122 RepID=UPI002442BA52|nr:acyl-CoA dehydrogenase family protein [Streptomyces sp. DH37]MDG9701971.1 acyl-CoA dehydrogenase family protein [Streptomyces sp. DH37]
MERSPGRPPFPRIPGPARGARREAEPFRRRIRAWISANAPAGAGGSPLWERTLLDAGLVCPMWPRRYGGAGLTLRETLVLEEECARAGVPRIGRGAGEHVIGPTVLAHGTAEQKARLLPAILAGDDRYCRAYSEPGHGSDLASVRTRGAVDGGTVVVTGRKSWVDGARSATVMLVLCRTDPEAPRHRGLSCVLVRLDGGDGVERRPVRGADGAHDLCEVLLDGARAPLRDVIGGVGGGWRTVLTALAHERASRMTGRPGLEAGFWDLVEAARKSGRTRDPLVRSRLAEAYTRMSLVRRTAERLAERTGAATDPGPEAALVNLLGAEYHRWFGELALDVVGAPALVRPDGDGYRTDRRQGAFLSGRAATIDAGTGEVLRDVIAERILGLPRDPAARAAVGGRRPGPDGPAEGRSPSLPAPRI